MINKKALAFVAVMLSGGAAVGAMSLRGDPPRKLRYAVDTEVNPGVTPEQLAQWVIEGRRDFVVVDFRDHEDFESGHIRGAVSCGGCHQNASQGRKAQEGKNFVDLTKKLVLYTQTGQENVELPKILAHNPRLHFLEGGYEAFQRDILAPVHFGGEATPEERVLKQRREAVRAFFAGERVNTAQPAELPMTPIRRENAHKPQGASEGC